MKRPQRTRIVWSSVLALAWFASEVFAEAGHREPDPLFIDAVDRARVEALSKRPGPRLVLFVVIDQMRPEFLPRAMPWLPAGGFRRLWDEGAVYRDCHIPYVVTATGPGHATLATGANPWHHGIVANGWFDETEGKWVGCVEDQGVTGVGGASAKASPHRLRANTIGDVLQTETLGHAKIVSLSAKDRTAIFLGSRRPTGVYWLDDQTVLPVTSDYYAAALPAWVESVRVAARARAARLDAWTPILEPAAYLTTVSRQGVPSFPSPASPEDAERLAASPYEVEVLFQMARAAVEGEGLGADGVPDLLALGVSTPDHIGHEFGPDSPEYLDICARVDRELAALLTFLDRRVGRGAYTVVLSADHGVSSLPEVRDAFEAVAFDTAGNWTRPQLEAWVTGVLDPLAAKGFERGETSWVRATWNGFVSLDPRLLAAAKLEEDRAASALCAAADGGPWTVGAFRPGEAGCARGPAPLVEAARRNYYPGRSGEMLLLLRPHVYPGSRTGNANHGTPYTHDTRVPLLFWGFGIVAGEHWERVGTVDVVPTLCGLLHLRPPASAEGDVLGDALAPRGMAGRSER